MAAESWGMEACGGAPFCFTWLQSACDPALATEDPALHTSIVDVADLAGSDRVLAVGRHVGLDWGGVLVQF